jgi:hypothetical protein
VNFNQKQLKTFTPKLQTPLFNFKIPKLFHDRVGKNGQFAAVE